MENIRKYICTYSKYTNPIGVTNSCAYQKDVDGTTRCSKPSQRIIINNKLCTCDYLKIEEPIDHGSGQLEGDWFQDIAGVTKKCTEEGCRIEAGEPYWWCKDRVLCSSCITLILNAREDHIKDLISEIKRLDKRIEDGYSSEAYQDKRIEDGYRED